MGRRTVLLTLSILLAAVAVVLIGLYVKGSDARAQTGVQTVYVLAPKGPVTQNTALSSNSAGWVELAMLKNSVPAGAVTSLSTLDGKTAAEDLQPGVPLVATMLSTGEPGSAGAATHGLDETVVLANQIPGEVQIGSYVRLFATVPGKSATVLMDRVEVVEINGKTENTSASGNSGNLTVRVTESQAESLATAQAGTVRLTAALIT